MRLEYYQLAESVIEIIATRQTSKSKKNNAKNLEYLLEFDKGFTIKSMWVDYNSLEKLSKMREELLPHLSPTWEAFELPRAHPPRSIAQTHRRSTSRHNKIFARVRSLSKARKDGEGTKMERAKSPKPLQGTRTIKQLWSLVEESTMGRRISFETYGVCHHCRRIKAIIPYLVPCKYSSQKNGFVIPNCLTINGCTLYNSLFRPLIK